MAEQVLIFSRSLPFHHLGGMEIVAWDLAIKLQDNGFEVIVITTDFDMATLVPENAPEIIKIKNIPKAKYSKGWWSETDKLADGWGNKENISAVISISAGAFGVLKHKKKFPNAKFIMQAHGTSTGELISKLKTRQPKKILASIKNIFGFYTDAKHYQYFDWIVAVGDAVSNDLIRFPNNLICNKDKVVKIENGIDENLFSASVHNKETLRCKLNISSKSLVFLCASRLHEQKGVDNNIDLFLKIKINKKDAKLLICGNGPYELRLRNKVVELKLSQDVIFLGAMTRLELANIMQCADVFLFLTKRVEGLPLNVLEAMSAGLPVIISEHLTFESGEKVLKCNPNDISMGKIFDFIDKVLLKERKSYIPVKNTLSYAVSKYISLFQRIFK